MIALADQMKTDGIVPFAFGNDGKWPAMGMFDILNMRINGYDFHISLMAGNEDWTSAEVKDVFAKYATLLPYHQEGANGRTWQDAAQRARAPTTTGMMMLGTFITGNSSSTEQTLDDLDFFPFPALNDDHRDRLDRGADRRLHDGGPPEERGRAPRQVLAVPRRAAPAIDDLPRRSTRRPSPPTATPTRRPTRRCSRSRRS